MGRTPPAKTGVARLFRLYKAARIKKQIRGKTKGRMNGFYVSRFIPLASNWKRTPMSLDLNFQRAAFLLRYALRLLSLVLTIRRQQADLLQYARQQAEFYTVQFYGDFQYRCKIVFSLPSGITLALGDFVFTNLTLDAEIY